MKFFNKYLYLKVYLKQIWDDKIKETALLKLIAALKIHFKIGK